MSSRSSLAGDLDSLALGAMDADDARLDRAVGLGCALDRFAEAADVLDLVRNRLPKLASDPTGWEAQRQQFETIMDRYQEQPHLLDAHLADVVDALLCWIRHADAEGNPALLHATSALAAHVVKVRGAKVIVVRHFPHEVRDVEPVVRLLEEQSPTDAQNWETRYVLLLWLSMLALVPFDLARFDSEGNRNRMTDRILGICKTYLNATDRAQDAASALTARLMTRPEMVSGYLTDFLDFCVQTVADTRRTDVERMGGLKALAAIFKHGKREDLLEHAPRLLNSVLAAKLRDHPNVLLRKLSLKVAQRLGLTFIKQRVASWRYQRGNRSLALNLGAVGDQAPGRNSAEGESEEGGYDIPDEIEEVIEELLCGLRDKSTVIRWSAAKGIGRVTGRLPKELADDVVDSLLNIFSIQETDGAWHGGCLALAELGRRGLLLPQRLSAVVRVILQALLYDEKKGSFSVGAHIRDAACYVCWAFARAYDPSVMMPFVTSIASALVTVTLFDREVNCRRAAAAAFQENVGRQGIFPHGIDILTTADYFAVGSRNNTYLTLSVQIARYSEYTDTLVDHLVKKKIGHWDVVIRELAAEALKNLALVSPERISQEILPRLLKEVNSVDLFIRHGAILAVGSVIHGLAIAAEKNSKSINSYLDSKQMEDIKGMFVSVVQKLSLRITGGDLLRQALATCIQNLSLAHYPCHETDTVDLWQAILCENISNHEPAVQERAVAAFPRFVEEYFRDRLEPRGLSTARRDALLEAFAVEFDASELHRRGIACALGSFPRFALAGKVGEILELLIRGTEIQTETDKWAEARRDAVNAISNLVKTVGVKREQDDHSIGESTLVRLFECFLSGLDDYSLDRRGDIGAWVREACMNALVSVTLFLARHEDANARALIPEVGVREMMPRLAQQAVEKIDRTRGLAAKLFASVILEQQHIPGIPEFEGAKEVFPGEINVDTFQWAVESETFPIFCRLLHLDAYRNRVILGLVVSVGGVTERLVKFASISLFNEIKRMSSSDVGKFCGGVLDVFKAHQKHDRVTVPLFKFLDQLLNSGHIDDVMENAESTFPADLLALLKTEVSKCGEPNKLMSSIDVLCSLLQSANLQTVRKCLLQLSIFLCHKFPRLRRYTANKLFEALLTYSDREIVPIENLDDINAVLSDTNWDQNVETLRLIRNNLCELMKVPPPVLITKVVT